MRPPFSPLSSPRAWGCFSTTSLKFIFHLGLPHVRGGVSRPWPAVRSQSASSPRAWGCFQRSPTPSPRKKVFPTCVGVFPGGVKRLAICSGLPHVRGGVSNAMLYWTEPKRSSPRAWGCFQSLCLTSTHPTVFPTCVGVFLKLPCSSLMTACLPHVRGGVSYDRRIIGDQKKSSPRAWGCFLRLRILRTGDCVFPTCVGVFPWSHEVHRLWRGLPHVRGGVSPVQAGERPGLLSSPRAWGCFRGSRRGARKNRVFPTCVGVFPVDC